MEDKKPFLKVDKKKRLVTGEVLVPEIEDAQGDIASEEEIEKAAHQFLINLVHGKLKDQALDVMHLDPTHNVELVETWLSPIDFEIVDCFGKKREIKKGTWLITSHISDDKVWKAIEDEILTGYSIQGSYNSLLEKREVT